MDIVRLLKRHTREYSATTDQGYWDDTGWVEDISTINFTGALLPLNSTDLQRIDRGDISFKDKKIYTKVTLNEDDEFTDRKTEKWIVFGELEYYDIADINVYLIRRVKNG